MKSNLLNATWYGERAPGFVLLALERIYRRGLDRRRRRGLAQRSARLAERPIIVVGNLTVGGAGKSPLVMRLCELAREAGLRPGVVSRGYGRRSREPVRVEAGMNAEDTGDEPLMIARRCDVPVMVDSDREAAVRTLFDSGEADLVIADDGLQRWQLPRDIEICVVDGVRGLGNGHLLPAGPLRESAGRLEVIDEVVINGSKVPDGMPGHAIHMELRLGEFISLADGGRCSTVAMARQSDLTPARAVAGIGRPERFFETLTSLGIRLADRKPLADHHSFRASDFEPPDALYLMTEKDAVKCTALALPNAWYLPVQACMPEAWEQRMRERMVALVKEKSP